MSDTFDIRVKSCESATPYVVRSFPGDDDRDYCPFINTDFGNCNLDPNVDTSRDILPERCPLRLMPHLVMLEEGK